MLAVIFALGRIIEPYWVGLAAGLGETVGALIIYVTGHGAGTALYSSDGRLGKIYMKLMSFMEKKGSLTLFILSSIINPFFYPAAIAAGAMRFGIRKYFIICFAGKTIKGLTVAYAGYWGLRGLLKMMGMPI
jgi:membrane protein YqaA with SNARE-associated domain